MKSIHNDMIWTSIRRCDSLGDGSKELTKQLVYFYALKEQFLAD